MDYKQKRIEYINTYKEMLEQYEEAVSSPRYFKIISSMPVEFLNAVQLCEKLALYERLAKKPHMYFARKEEALFFYQNLITFRKNTEILLDDASFMAEIGRKANEINQFVTASSYLDNTCCVVPNTDVIAIAEKCLKQIPQYPRMCSKEFRWNFIESCIISLEKEDIEWLVEKGVIKANDLDHINLVEKVNQYQDKINDLYQIFGITKPTEMAIETKLKGVSFDNDKGVSRQEGLMKLLTEFKLHPEREQRLELLPYIYQPSDGAPEDAIKVIWNGQDIGNISKDLVNEIHQKFIHPQFTAKLVDVYGGSEDKKVGCKILLSVIGQQRNLEKEEEKSERNIS